MENEADEMRSLISKSTHESKNCDAKEDPATHAKLIALLEASVDYIHRHEAVLTSEQAAKVRGGRIEEGAKAILMRISIKRAQKGNLCALRDGSACKARLQHFVVS